MTIGRQARSGSDDQVLAGAGVAVIGGKGLIGRHAETGRLRALLADLERGRGRAVWVEGEPGIGKSAVLEAALDAAERTACRVFRGAADEMWRPFPLRLMLDCLVDGPMTGAGPDTGELLRREIADVLAGGSGAMATPFADPTPALTELLLVLVDRLCAATPVALVADDLQWADSVSLAVWQRLSRLVHQLPLLLVGACRPVPRRPELAALRRGLKASDVVLIELGPLPDDAVAELARGLVLSSIATSPATTASASLP